MSRIGSGRRGNQWPGGQAPVLRPPALERRITHSYPPAEFLYWNSSLRFFQRPDNLFFTYRLFLIGSSPLASYIRRSYVLPGYFSGGRSS
jgi:hypothetical protein